MEWNGSGYIRTTQRSRYHTLSQNIQTQRHLSHETETKNHIVTVCSVYSFVCRFFAIGFWLTLEQQLL